MVSEVLCSIIVVGEEMQHSSTLASPIKVSKSQNSCEELMEPKMEPCQIKLKISTQAISRSLNLIIRVLKSQLKTSF